MPVSVPFAFALENPPFEVSPEEAIAAVKDVLSRSVIPARSARRPEHTRRDQQMTDMPSSGMFLS